MVAAKIDRDGEPTTTTHMKRRRETSKIRPNERFYGYPNVNPLIISVIWMASDEVESVRKSPSGKTIRNCWCSLLVSLTVRNISRSSCCFTVVL